MGTTREPNLFGVSEGFLASQHVFDLFSRHWGRRILADNSLPGSLGECVVYIVQWIDMICVASGN